MLSFGKIKKYLFESISSILLFKIASSVGDDPEKVT